MAEAAGWYPDPMNPERDRLWDGADWTAYTRTRLPHADDGPQDLTDTSAYGYLTLIEDSSPMARPLPPDAPERIRGARRQRFRTAAWYATIVLIVIALVIMYGGIALIVD